MHKECDTYSKLSTIVNTKYISRHIVTDQTMQQDIK